ncbi:MAG: pyridoxamine 5'-phosphate oxidase family protein [Thermosynechococcaceae cyanobacterium]
MGKVYEGITGSLKTWLYAQKVFFVATAPHAPNGHINCSPKGGESFRVIDEHTVAYQDMTGSGIETVAHLRENGRIVLMFCAFEGPPKIVRLHGIGTSVVAGDPHFDELRGTFPDRPGLRSIIQIKVNRVSDSCGFGVPFMAFQGSRDDLDRWAESKSDSALEAYRRDKNAVSLDGLPGMV